MSTFDRFAPFIQDFIYRNGWQSLRGVQVAAADVIFNTDKNLLLTASTASGKTEAAFFPILTLFSEDFPRSIGALYIAPLKALINDQYLRLDELCAEGGIPVWHRHGDVSETHKRKMTEKPSGVLQITPESLEALLMRRPSDIPRLFGDLRFIVIDEIHSLMRGDRGAQTLCLVERLSKLAGVNPRRIGLSATIGDPGEAAAFLGSGSGRETLVPEIEAPGVRWKISMEHFYVEGPQASEEREVKEYLPETNEKTDEAPENADPGLKYIYEYSKGKKCLVFSNSREECEAVTSTLRQYCRLKREPDRFLIHHGNLSASYRESAEDLMKNDDVSMTTCTTSTLELGIDIGRLERAFQIDAPFTVSSFLQRMGRTGRRGQPQEMCFVMREDPPEMRAMLPTTVPWKLLQGIALVQTYLEEKWVEPPRLSQKHYSLLFHQTLSVLVSAGPLTPAALASRVLSLAAFGNIGKEDYKILLKYMLENDMLEKTETGELMVGLAGERVTNSFKFYAVFKENDEYTVRCASEEIGSIVMPPPVGEKIALAGKIWLVEEIDHKKRLIYCKGVEGKVPAYFGDCPGDINTKILERMKKALNEDTVYPYLMKNASARIERARFTAKNAGVDREPLVCLGGSMWALFPWLGSYAFLAIERFIKIRCGKALGISSVESARPYYITFKMKGTKRDFFDTVFAEAAKPLDPMELVYPGEEPVFEKYDGFVPPELIRKGFAHGVLNTEEMFKRIEEWKKAYG